MGMTIGEKIIARAAKVDQVKAGEIHTIEVDRLMSNDGTTHLTIDMYHNQLKHPKIADKDKLVFIMDHNVPAENPKTAAAHRKMRNFAKEHEIKLYEGKGVCHQIMVENGYMTRITQAILVDLQDEIGGLDKLLSVMGDSNVNLHYIYTFFHRGLKVPVAIMHCEDLLVAESVLRNNGFKVLNRLVDPDGAEEA